MDQGSEYSFAMEDLHRQPAEASSDDLDDLFLEACPSSRDEAFYNLQMKEAAKRGLSFPQALEFAANRRYEAELLSRFRGLPPVKARGLELTSVQLYRNVA